MLTSKPEKYAQDEFDAARIDLGTSPPTEALLRFYRRLDQALSEAALTSDKKPACGPGCSYCCHYKVVARAVEVIAIQQYVVSRFSQTQIKTAIAQAAFNVNEAKDISHEEHLAINQPCPFLVDQKCSIYPVRPSKCRSFHASDVEGCKRSFENPQDLTIQNSYVWEVFEAGFGSSQGFDAAASDAGLDSRVYDLNSAFLEAMNNSGSAKRLKNKKKVFLGARTETPLGE